MSSYSGDSLPLCLILNPGNDSSILEKCLFKSVDLQPSPLECSWQWNVSNKYYTCSVGLRCVKSTGEVSEKDLELCEAFIVYLEEFCCSDHLALVQAFASKLENSAETKLIATQKFRSEEDRLQLHTWAAKNALEIIDFSEDDEEDDSGIFSSTGAQRVIEALHTTPWPNMERRKSQNTKPGAAQTKAATKTDSAQGEEQRREEKNNKQNGNELDAALLPDVAEVLKAVGDFGDGSAGNKGRGEEDDDDFEELFSKFASIKDRASGMSDNERKAYAEKVATSFWMALGGEDDEVGGLDSDTE